MNDKPTLKDQIAISKMSDDECMRRSYHTASGKSSISGYTTIGISSGACTTGTGFASGAGAIIC